MSKTILILGAVVIVILIAVLLIFNQSSKEQSIQEVSTGGGGVSVSDEDGEKNVIDDGEAVQPPFSSNVITYTDSGYSPQELTVAKGDTVIFRNESSQQTWPASTVHPTHTVYPGSDIQKCFDGDSANDSVIFDACHGLEPGEEWNFTFNEKGSWNYHNHLHATQLGTIIVE